MANRRASFGKDTGLQARMLLTMFLLGLVYVVFVGVLFAAGAGAVTIVAVALVLLLRAAVHLRQDRDGHDGRQRGLARPGARAARDHRAPVRAGRPAQAAGVRDGDLDAERLRDGPLQKSTTVCATRGILDLLSPAELEGVMAHELTHVINRDVMVMTLASFFATLASMIAAVRLFFGGGFGGGYGRDSEEEEGIMLVLLVSVLVYAISFLLLRALSRYREFAADRGSAVLTGRPSALASALLKISGTMERMPSQDLRAAEGMSAFFILPARTKKSLMNIFADHPPLEQRLAALERLESQLQGTA